MTEKTTTSTETATLGGGCFWCLEAVFDELEGVLHVESGYSGGTVANPTYRQVCTGTTNHAEVVQITFDPAIISFQEILGVFFDVHDPTTLNRQGAYVGTQYRSAIFYHNDRQKAVASSTIAELETKGVWRNPIVTQVAPLTAFYEAETYHQEYYQNNARQPYCRAVIAPKLTKFRKLHAAKLVLQ